MLPEQEINNLVENNNKLKQIISEMVDALETSADLLNLAGIGHNTVIQIIGLVKKSRDNHHGK